MTSLREDKASEGAGTAAPQHPSLGPGPDSELTWLLHRAAQRMRTVTGDAAEAHGVSLRDHIVLSALHMSPGMTQVELGRAVGMDKTTLTSELYRLEKAGLVERAVDVRDRRARTLTITAAGDKLRSAVAVLAQNAENDAVSGFAPNEVERFRQMLFDLIGTKQDPGSCL